MNAFATSSQRAVSTHFHKTRAISTKKYSQTPFPFGRVCEYLTNQRRSNPPVGESRQEPSREPATELTRHSGNWASTDGIEKALTANVTAEEDWEMRAPLAKTGRTLKWQSVVIWAPEPDLRKIGKQGRVLARDLALSLCTKHCNCGNNSLVVTAPTTVAGSAATTTTTMVSLIPGTVFRR